MSAANQTGEGGASVVELPWHPLLAPVERFRYVIFGLIAILFACGFNGQWRVGRDSALYRSVARNLAEGRGYTYNGKVESHAYPGLPALLTVVNRTFGDNPLQPMPALLLMMGMAAATLAVVYRLIRIHYPCWVAVTVTSGLAINWQFVMLANEVLTDIPFVLGVSVALLGFERLRLAQGKQRVGLALLTLIVGLALAAVMRPTFWALALAWSVACVWGLFRGPNRLRYGLALAVILAPIAIFLMIDPRANSMLAGRYEHDAARAVTEFAQTTWWPRLVAIFDRHLVSVLFGTAVAPGLNTAISLAFVVCGLALVRRVPLWGMYLLVTLAMTFFLGSVPRYYLMVLPIMLLGWTVMIARLVPYAARVRGGVPALFILGFWVVTGANFVKDLSFIAEQHGLTSDGRKPFLQVYHRGTFEPIVRMSEQIARRVPPEARVLGPEPRIMSYLSRRHVVSLHEELRGVHRDKRQAEFLRLQGDTRRKVRFVVLPGTAYEQDYLSRELIRRHIIQAQDGKKLARVGRLSLARVAVSSTGKDLAKAAQQKLKQLKELKKQKELKRLKLEKKKKAQRAAARAATRPATAP